MKIFFVLTILLIVSSTHTAHEWSTDDYLLTSEKHHAVMCAMYQGKGTSKIKSLLSQSGKCGCLCGTNKLTDLPVGLIEDLLCVQIQGISKRADNADKKREQKLYDQVVRNLDYRFEKRSLESVSRQMESFYYTNHVKCFLSFINTKHLRNQAIYPGIIMVFEKCSKEVRDRAWKRLSYQDGVDQKAIKNTKICALKYFRNPEMLPF
jgi:hypothetical protein